MVVKNFTTTDLYPHMIRIGSLFLIFILGSMFISTAYADDTLETSRAQISVTNVSLNPGTFEPFDTGTLTCVIKNSGQTPVPIDRVTIYDNDIILISREYDTTTWISPGESRTFTFSIRARCGDGTYYPILSVNTRESGSVRYPVKVKVDSTKPVVSIEQKPDTYSDGKKETVGLAISNPRENEIRNLHLIPSGNELELSPTDTFIGSLQPGETRKVSFDVTPTVETNLTFTLQYSNGENDHETSRTLPMVFGYDKKQADPYVSNLIVKSEETGYHITGDVTNAGMKNAVSVVVTTSDPAVPIYPYKEYVVGALKPDDFSSFELTFTAQGLEVIPIEVIFKDDDGNLYNRTTDLDLTNAIKPDEKAGINPLLVLFIVLCLGGGALYVYRKRILPGVFR
jgi:hypothetical protein